MPLPAYDVAIFMCHCWPTVHDYPAQLTDMLTICSRPTVPSEQQMAFMLRKTVYMSEFLRQKALGAHNVPLLPTKIVLEADDLAEAATVCTCVYVFINL